MKEVKRTEKQLVFSNGDVTVKFNRLEHGIAMEVDGSKPNEELLSINNFVSYIAWEHHVDMNNIEHGRGPSPHISRGNWDKLINDERE